MAINQVLGFLDKKEVESAIGIELSKIVGVGKAGEVWKCRAINPISKRIPINRDLAIKFYNNWVLELTNQDKRIELELNAGIATSDESVVNTYDVIDVDISGRRTICLVMEFIEGDTLDLWIKKQESPLNEEVVLNIVFHLTKGLHDLHGLGLIHRDLKPQNIIIEKGGLPKIMDLGVVRDINDETFTSSAQFLGTIRYAAPEYLINNVIDPQIDIYAIGAILYELLTGSTIYSGISRFSSLVFAVRDEDPILPTKLEGHSGFVKCLVYNLLQKEPKMRIANTEQLLNILELRNKSPWWKEQLFTFLPLPPHGNKYWDESCVDGLADISLDDSTEELKFDAAIKALKTINSINSRIELLRIGLLLKEKSHSIKALSGIWPDIDNLQSSTDHKNLINNLLSDESPYFRDKGIDLIAKYGNEQLLNRLLVEASSKNLITHPSLPIAAGRLGSHKFVPFLEKIIVENSESRKDAITALGKIGSKRAVKRLLQEIESNSANRNWTAQVLSQIPTRSTLKAIIKYIDEFEEETLRTILLNLLEDLIQIPQRRLKSSKK